MTEKNLNDLRIELEKINLNFFEILAARKETVDQISEVKNTKNVFDAQREISYFLSLTPMIKNLTKEELLAFSLIIQSHAQQQGKTYPAFSKGEHLNNQEIKSITDLINPILLYYYDANEYRKLDLKDKYKFF